MKSIYTLRQKLIIPFLIFTGMIVVGVHSIYKGVLLQQAWRVLMAATGVVCIGTLMVVLLLTVYRQEKAEKAGTTLN